MVSDLGHRLLDLAWENYRVNKLHEEPRGSTGRGITPSYADEVGQFQIQYADFLGDREKFAKKLSAKLQRACDTIKYVCGVSEADWDGFFDTLTRAEIRANGDAIKDGVFAESEFDFHPFKGAKAFELNVEKIGAEARKECRRRSQGVPESHRRRPLHCRRIRAVLLARQTPRLRPQCHGVAHGRSRILPKCGYSRYARPHYRLLQGVRH